MSLAEIRDPECERCALHTGANHVCLLGVAPKRKARVMVVGEAPGANEDEQGRPFIGNAGQLLNELLKNAGIKRAECYVTNAVKCRPPGNRKPKASEVKTCAHGFLYKELGEVQPEFVLTLGNVGMQAVTGKSGITKHRGVAKVKYLAAMHPDGTLQHEPLRATVFSTFHPAAILRNPKYREPTEADLHRFARIVDGLAATDIAPTAIKICRTKRHLQWLRRHLMQADVVSFDLETFCDHPQALQADKANLQEYRGDEWSHVCSISFSTQEGTSYVVPLWHEQAPWGVTMVDGEPRLSKLVDVRILQYLKPAFERAAGVKYIGHNGKYDVRWLRAKGIKARLTFCTLTAAHMLDENRMNGLKPLSQVVLGADAYDVGDELKDAHQMPLKRLCIYNGKDTDYTLRLYRKLREQLIGEPRTLRVFALLMMPAANALVDIERRGIAIDLERLATRLEQCRSNMHKLEGFMRRHVPDVLEVSDTNIVPREQFNPGSTQQVAALLFDYLGLNPVEWTDSGAPSTDKSVLNLLRDEHVVVQALLLWRKWKKREGYLKAWTHFQHDGRLHPTYNPTGTVTGRLSGSNPNVQQVPRTNFMRSIFRAQEGWSLVQADYSQGELRIAFMLAEAKRGLRLYATGGDVHTDRAARITNKLPQDVTKEERSRAKPVSFGFLFAMGHKKFVTYARDEYGVDYTEPAALAVRNGFFDDYPELLIFHDKQRRLVRKYGRVTSMFGRTRHLPDIYSHDEGVRRDAERQAINTVIQSPLSDLMLCSLVAINAVLPEKEARIVGTIHDSLLTEIRDDKVDEWAPFIKQEMENLDRPRRMFGAEFTVPMPVDIEVGTHWGGN